MFSRLLACLTVSRRCSFIYACHLCRSLLLIPGEEPESFTPPCDLRITNVALGDELEDETGRTSVKLTYTHPSGGDSDDEEDSEDGDKDSVDDLEPITTVLCSLTPGKVRVDALLQFLSAN